VHLYASDVKRKLPDGDFLPLPVHDPTPSFLHLLAATMMLKSWRCRRRRNNQS
jgi:hypothetical protein